MGLLQKLLRSRKKPIICIGANKTGTTSLEAFFVENGFKAGNQVKGENLIGDYARKNWKPILDLVDTADFFQDLPFSARGIYRPIAAHFPQAKFILTVRESAEEWYESMMRFYSKKFSDGTSPPNAEMLKNAKYLYPGFMWDANRALYDTPESDPYQKTALIQWYRSHNEEARSFFEGTGRLLEVCISDVEAVKKISNFVGFEAKSQKLPHLNKSRE